MINNIFGIFNQTFRPVYNANLQAMTAHSLRSGDIVSFYLNDFVGIGTSHTKSNSVTSINHVFIVATGRLDNRTELFEKIGIGAEKKNEIQILMS